MGQKISTICRRVVAVFSAVCLSAGFAGIPSPAQAAATTSGIIFWGKDASQMPVEGNVNTPVGMDAEFLNVGENIDSIAVGGGHSCALTSTGRVFCWGDNALGQAGTGLLAPRIVQPTEIASVGETFKQVSAGWGHACALSTDNQVYCWGDNGDGHLGTGNLEGEGTPTLVGGLPNNVVEVSAGGYGTCALTATGAVYCWGDNGLGGVGKGDIGADALTPVNITNSAAFAGKTLIDIEVSGYQRCALATDGSLFCWGGDQDSEAGVNSATPVASPTLVNTFGDMVGEKIASMGLGGYHSCVVTESNKILCWGYNLYFTAGNDGGDDELVPVEIDDYGVLEGKTIKQVTGGYYYSCALATDGTVGCWGYNSNAEPYLGTVTEETSVAVPVSPSFGDTIPVGQIVTTLYGGGWSYGVFAKTGVPGESKPLPGFKKTIKFNSKSAALDMGDKKVLKSLASKIKARAKTHTVLVQGWSSKRADGVDVAKARAVAVKKYLTAQGVTTKISTVFKVGKTAAKGYNRSIVIVERTK